MDAWGSGLALDETDRAQLSETLRALTEVLVDDLLGACVHGSAVIEGLRPRSDIDVLAVAARRLTKAETRSLIGRLLAISGPDPMAAPPRPLEVTIVAEPEIRPWRFPPVIELQYGEWWRDELVRGEEPWTSPNPDTALLIAMARAADVPLVGPSPSTLFEAVPMEYIREALVSGMWSVLRDLDHDRTNVILTLARIWHGLSTGELTSKNGAATWAASRLDDADRSVLEHARAVYVGDARERWEGQEEAVRRYADRLRARIVAAGTA